MNGLKRGGALLDRDFDRFYVSEGYQSDPADWGKDWDNLIGSGRRDKTPADLRDFSIVKAVEFKDGIYRKIRVQKAASNVRRIKVTPELNSYYCALMAWVQGGKIGPRPPEPLRSAAQERRRKQYNAMWDHIEGGRKVAGLEY